MNKLTYEESQALAVMRRLIRKKPELATALLEGISKDVAVNVLLQAKKELADLLIVTQAITEAASALVKMDKPEENPND